MNAASGIIGGMSMKTFATGAGLTLALGCLALPAIAQQIPPVVDSKAAAACAPPDLAAAVDCLEKHLKPEFRNDVAKAATPEALLPSEIHIGLWMRNNWGFWTGSPLAQYMLSKRVTQPDVQSNRIVQALWLKGKGCRFDWNHVGYIVAAMDKAIGTPGSNPCEVTVAEAEAAARNPMSGRYAAYPNANPGAGRAAAPAAGRAGRAGRAGAQTVNPNAAANQGEGEDDPNNPNQ